MAEVDLVTTVQRDRVQTLYGSNDITGTNDADLNFPAGIWEVQGISIYASNADLTTVPTPILRFRAYGDDQLYYPRLSFVSGIYPTNNRAAVYYCEPVWRVNDGDWLEVKTGTWSSGAMSWYYFVQAIRLR